MKYKIFVDYREDKNIYSMLEDDEFEIEITTLQCGDYLCNNVLIERKSDNDFISSVRNNLIFQQCQDMLSNPEITPYILITSSLRSLEYQGFDKQYIVDILTGLNRRGIITFLVDNSDNFIFFVKTFFRKYSSDKVRLVNPIRKPVSNEDKILYSYYSLPEIGIELAGRLKERFSCPKDLYNASIEQLMEIEGIGKKKAEILYNFFNGGINE